MIYAKDFTDEHKAAILRRLQDGETRKEVAFIVGCSPDLIGCVIRDYPPYQEWIKTTTNRRPDVDHRARLIQQVKATTDATTKELAEQFAMTEAAVRCSLRRELAE